MNSQLLTTYIMLYAGGAANKILPFIFAKYDE